MRNKFSIFLVGLIFGLFGAVSISQAASLSPGDVLTVDPSAPGEAGVFKLDSSTWGATLISSNGYFSEPMGIALSNDGNILIGDPQYPNGSGPGAIFKVDAATGAQTILSSGNLFTDPRGIAVAANGDIFVADPDAFNYYGGVIKVDPNTGAQTKIYQSADINAGPLYLAFEANGNLVVSDVSGASKGVVRVNPTTGIGVQLAVGGNFVYPQGIAVAANGDIFVADNAGKIIKINPVSGAQTVIASGYPLVCPVGLAFDNSGDLLVSDPCNEPGAIIKVNPTTGAANVVANNFGSISPNGIIVVPSAATPPAVSKDVVVGSCSGWCGSYGNDLLKKLDSAGNVLWTKNIGAIAISINPTDHSIVIGDQYGHVKKLDSNGNVLWDKNFNVTYAFAVSVNSANGSIVAGISSGHVVKLDANGSVLWDKNLNLPGVYSVSINPSNGSIVVGGRDASDAGHVIKLDSNGNVLWDKSVNLYQVYKATVAVNLADGSIAVGTPTGLIKLDSNGNVLWNKNTGYSSETVSVNPTDGSIAVGTWTGRTVLKLDSSGNILWNKNIGANALVVSVSSVDGSIAVGTQWYNRAVKLDSNGNTLWDKNMGTNTWSVAVESYFVAPDTISPTINIPSDIIAEATSAAGVAVTYEASATDNVGVTSFVCAPASGSIFPIGNTTVTCTASDAAGNTASASFNVIIEDTAPPTITAPSDITVPASSPAGASGVVLGVPAVSDVVDLNPLVTNNSPAIFPIGTTIVVWTAQDQAGNSAQAIQQVVVLPLPPEYTDAGSDVSVTPISGVTLIFSNVSISGLTTVTTSSAGPALPTYLKLGNPPIYYDINTTAVYNPPVEVCFSYAGVNYQNENNLKLRHFDGISWTDITKPGYPDTTNKIICGITSALSPFAITEPAEVVVKIDIKPGSYPNPINLKSNGKIPVAILSSAAFNALTQTDKASLTFGRTGDEKSLSFCNVNGEDVNNDGLLDLVCHFQTRQTDFRAGDTEGKLKGKTIGGTPLAGNDSLRLVPAN